MGQWYEQITAPHNRKDGRMTKQMRYPAEAFALAMILGSGIALADEYHVAKPGENEIVLWKF